MPTTIFLKGGVKFSLKGDGPGTIIKRFLRPMAQGIALSGHLVEFRWQDRLFIEAQPEAEYQAQLAAQAAAEAKQREEQAKAQEKQEADRTAAIRKAAEDVVAKYGPLEENRPEAWRTKKPAEPAAY